MNNPIKTDLTETAFMLADLMPMFAVKFIKHAERKCKNIFSPLQMHALFALSCEEKLSMSELARMIVVSKQQLTPIIDKLIEVDLVMREHDQVDRRNITIRLSENGKAFIEEKRCEMSDMIRDLLSCLPENDLEALNRSAREISTVLHKLP